MSSAVPPPPVAPPPEYSTAINYPMNDSGYSQPSAPPGYSQPALAGYGDTQPAGSYNQPGGYGYGQPGQYAEPTIRQPASDAVHLKDDDTDGVWDVQGNMASFSDKAVRRAFVRKVYLILMTQLLFTVGIICLFMFVMPVQRFVQGTPAFYYVSYGVFIVTYFTLVCVPSVRRNYPGNFICLTVFTVALTYMVATITSTYETKSILVAAGITAGVCLAVTIFAIQTKIDFTMCSGLLFVLLIVLFLFGIITIVFWRVDSAHILHSVYGGLGALVFGMFLIYDTQMLMGGRKHELSPEEYIYGALQLYLDIVYIFLFLLSIFGSSK